MIKTEKITNKYTYYFLFCINRNKIQSPNDVAYYLCDNGFHDLDLSNINHIRYKRIIDSIYDKISKNTSIIDFRYDNPYVDDYLSNHTEDDFYNNHVWFSISDLDIQTTDGIPYKDLITDYNNYFSGYPFIEWSK